MKKLIVISLIIMFIVLVGMENRIFAMSVTDLNPQYTQESIGAVNSIGQELLGIIRNITAISAVVILAFIGLKFMFGSIEQKAEYKKSLLPLFIGVMVVLSSTTITSLVWKMRDDTQSNQSSQLVQPTTQSNQSSQSSQLVQPTPDECSEGEGHQWEDISQTMQKCSKCGVTQRKDSIMAW